jgi:hypothetical protein
MKDQVNSKPKARPSAPYKKYRRLDKSQRSFCEREQELYQRIERDGSLSGTKLS